MTATAKITDVERILLVIPMVDRRAPRNGTR